MAMRMHLKKKKKKVALFKSKRFGSFGEHDNSEGKFQGNFTHAHVLSSILPLLSLGNFTEQPHDTFHRSVFLLPLTQTPRQAYIKWCKSLR